MWSISTVPGKARAQKSALREERAFPPAFSTDIQQQIKDAARGHPSFVRRRVVLFPFLFRDSGGAKANENERRARKPASRSADETG